MVLILANTLTGNLKSGIKYLITEKDLNDFPSQSVDMNSKDHSLLPFKFNLDMTKVKQLQQ